MMEQQQHARQSHRKQSIPQRSCLDPALKSAPSPISSTPQWTTHQQPALPASSDEDMFPFGVSTAAAPRQPAAPRQQAGTDTTAGKGRTSRVKQPAKTLEAGCSFCPAVQSPVWRKGPAQYPRLCYRCGTRFYRYQLKNPPQDPFTPKILANLVRKSNAAAAAAAAADGDDSEEYEYPARRRTAAAQTCKTPQPAVPAPRPAPAATATAAATAAPAPGQVSPMQGVLGKRVRKASAKQLALEEQGVQDEGHQQHTKKAARRGRQQQQDEEEEEAAGGSDGVESAPEGWEAEVGTIEAELMRLFAMRAILQGAQRQGVGQLPAHGPEVVDSSLDSTATEEEEEEEPEM